MKTFDLLVLGPGLFLLCLGVPVGGGTSWRYPQWTWSSPPTKAQVGGQAVLACDLELPAGLRNAGGLELVWAMEELDTGTRHELARHSGVSEGYLAGSTAHVTASWQAMRWSLHLRNISREDGGYYECQLLLDGSTLDSREIYLSVPMLKAESSATFVIPKAGGNVTLDCSDLEEQLRQAGQPAVWHKDGDTRVVQTGNQFIRVDRDDSGVYYCSVSVGVAKNSSLQVNRSPAAIPVHTTVKQAPGYPAILRCDVSSFPVSLVRWYRLPSVQQSADDYSAQFQEIRAGKGVELSLDNFKNGQFTFSLRLENVSMTDYGLYSCNATNEIGEDSAVLSLEYSRRPVLYKESGDSASSAPVLSPLILLAFVLLQGGHTGL